MLCGAPVFFTEVAMHWVIPVPRGGDGAYGGSQRAPWAITGLVVEADVQHVVYNAPSEEDCVSKENAHYAVTEPVLEEMGLNDEKKTAHSRENASRGRKAAHTTVTRGATAEAGKSCGEKKSSITVRPTNTAEIRSYCG